MPLSSVGLVLFLGSLVYFNKLLPVLAMAGLFTVPLSPCFACDKLENSCGLGACMPASYAKELFVQC